MGGGTVFAPRSHSLAGVQSICRMLVLIAPGEAAKPRRAGDPFPPGNRYCHCPPCRWRNKEGPQIDWGPSVVSGFERG